MNMSSSRKRATDSKSCPSPPSPSKNNSSPAGSPTHDSGRTSQSCSAGSRPEAVSSSAISRSARKTSSPPESSKTSAPSHEGCNRLDSSRRASLSSLASSSVTGADSEAITSCVAASKLSPFVGASFWSESSSSHCSSSASSVTSTTKKRKRAKSTSEDSDSSAASSTKKRKSVTSGSNDSEKVGRQVVMIQHPLPQDVLFGRGRDVNSHCGNISLRGFVAERKGEYTGTQSRPKKNRIAREVFARVKSLNPPGRFLEKAKEAGDKVHHWVEVDEAKALQKISQALRQKPSNSGNKRVNETSVLDSNIGTSTNALPTHISAVFQLNATQLKEEAKRVMARYGLSSKKDEKR